METCETEHFILRAPSESDLDDNYAMMRAYENIRYLLTDAQSKEQCLAYIRYAMAKNNEDPREEYHFAAVLKGTRRVIGCCSLSLAGPRQGGLSSVVIHPDYRGKGYGSELVGFLLKLAFEDLQLRRVISSCDTRNVASYRAMERQGMRREGHFIQGRLPSKREPDFFGDEYAYGMLREEYLAKGSEQ